MNIIKYKISDNEYLKINPDVCVHEDECQFCARIDIDYIDEKNNVCIRFGYNDLSNFCYFFTESKRAQKLLNRELVLYKNIVNDLGFEWNQFYAGKQKSDEVFKYHWVSNSHKQIPPYYNSWLYNDEYGNIILEITPFYPWFGETKKTYPEKISYKEWIKNYKPTVKVIISQKNMKQWIKQAEELEKKYELKF